MVVTSSTTYRLRCLDCGREFFRQRSHYQFCSRICSARSNGRLNGKSKLYDTRYCQQCRESFMVPSCWRCKSDQRFCSPNCYYEFERQKQKPLFKTCGCCGQSKEFTKVFFPCNRRARWGLVQMCRPCVAAKARVKNKPGRIKIRLQILTHYSDGKLSCRCCGESHYEFLTIDHIDNNGAEERKTCKPASLFWKLRREGYPPGYQVLCWNCNCCRGIHGYCPHQK